MIAKFKKYRLCHLQRLFLILIFFVFTCSVAFMAPGRAEDLGKYMTLTLDEAKAMALQNNNELQIAKTTMETAQLVLDNFNEAISEIDEQEEELAENLIIQKERRRELQKEIEELEQQEEALLNELEELLLSLEEGGNAEEILEIIQQIQDLQQELLELLEEEGSFEEIQEILQQIQDLQQELLLLLEEVENIEDYQEIIQQIQNLQQEMLEVQTQLVPLRAELLQVEAAIQVSQLAYDNFDFIVEQLRIQLEEANQALQSAKETLATQEELLLFGVEALFAVCIIIEEQFPLQEEGYYFVSELIETEKLKEESGYSTIIQVMETEAQLRDIDRAGDALETKYIEILDQLCMLIGLRPGTNFHLVSFLPENVKEVNLNESLENALSEGRLMEWRRESLDLSQQELAGLEELFGDEEDFEDSFLYQQALLRVELAEQELKQAEDQIYAEVRKTYYALKDSEREIARCEESIIDGLLQEKALLAAYESGYSTSLETAAGHLNIIKKEADLLSARYQYHIKLREFELVTRGYITSGFTGQGDFSETGFSQGGFSQPGFSSFSSEPSVLGF